MTISILSGEIRKLTRAERERTKSSYKYMVISQFTFTDTDSGDQRRGSTHYYIRVPAGFLTDGASAGAPDLGSSWLFHDWLYANHAFTSGQTCTRAQADEIMYKVLKHERLRFYAWGFRKLARLNPFWGFSRAWRRSGDRSAEFLGGYEEP